MKKDILEARIRQIAACDKNAFDIYSELVLTAPDEETKKILSKIKRQEFKHLLLEKKMLELLKG